MRGSQIATFISSFGTLVVAAITFFNMLQTKQAIELTRLGIVADKYPFIVPSLSELLQSSLIDKDTADAVKEYKEDDKRLQAWATEENYIILELSNYQTAPVGYANSISIEYKIIFPRADNPEEIAEADKSKTIQSLRPKDDKKLILFKFSKEIQFFKIEITDISYINPLSNEKEWYNKYCEKCIAEKENGKDDIGISDKIF
jgi:hypothetical protein